MSEQGWTEEQSRELVAMIAAGKTTAQAADTFNRSPEAVDSKINYMRSQGVKVSSPRREAPQGVGRPPNKRPTVKLWMRLHKSTKGELACVLSEFTPQQRLELALEHYLGEGPELPECEQDPQELPRDERCAAQWCVDAALLARAVKRSKVTRPKTAELAIEQLLAHYGYTFESTDNAT